MTAIGPRCSPAAVAARAERNGDRTGDPWPPATGSVVGYVEVCRYGAVVRIELRQVRGLVKQQRATCEGQSLGRMGLARAALEAVRRSGRVAAP